MSRVENRSHGCNRSYIVSNYPNHLRSQGQIVNVMKKRCCSCNITITQNKLCNNNHELTYCMNKLSLKSDVDIQTDISDKQSE